MKKNVTNKVISILTLASILMTSGCGKVTSTTSPTAATGVTKLAPYELKVVYPATGTPVDLPLVQTEMNKQLTATMNATVVLQPIEWGAWGDKTRLMFASGEKIDVISSSVNLAYSQNVVKGAYYPIDELLKTSGKDIVSALGMDYLKGTAMNGKMYGVPVLKEYGQAYGLVFNKAIVDKYKFDISTIKTYKDLEPMLKIIKENEPGITPLCESLKNICANFGTQPLFDTLGIDYGGVLPYNSKDFKLISQYDFSPYVDSLKWTHDMFLKGYVNKSSLTDQDEGPMKTGKAFVIPCELKPGKDAELSIAWGYPVVQTTLFDCVSSATAAEGIMESIGQTSKDPERAMMFINALFNDKKLLNTFVFGVEGKDYVKKSDNIIDFPAGIDAKSVGYRNEGWMFGNQFSDFLFSSENPKKWDEFKAFNAKAKKSPAIGFAFDSESVKTEIAALDNVNNKYNAALLTGSVDPAVYLPKLVSDLKAAGWDKVAVEKQKQLDAWVKTK